MQQEARWEETKKALTEGLERNKPLMNAILEGHLKLKKQEWDALPFRTRVKFTIRNWFVKLGILRYKSPPYPYPKFPIVKRTVYFNIDDKERE